MNTKIENKKKKFHLLFQVKHKKKNVTPHQAIRCFGCCSPTEHFQNKMSLIKKKPRKKIIYKSQFLHARAHDTHTRTHTHRERLKSHFQRSLAKIFLFETFKIVKTTFWAGFTNSTNKKNTFYRSAGCNHTRRAKLINKKYTTLTKRCNRHP